MVVFGFNKWELIFNVGFFKIFVCKISMIVIDLDKKNIEFKNFFYFNLLYLNKYIKK